MDSANYFSYMETVHDPMDDVEDDFDDDDDDDDDDDEDDLDNPFAYALAAGVGAPFLLGEPVPQQQRGTGYGGDASSDKKQRKKGAKEAKKRETDLWKSWQNDFKVYLAAATRRSGSAKKKRHEELVTPTAIPPSNALLQTVKQVLRCNATDWWWKRPQKPLYVAALRVCLVVTEKFPELLLAKQNQDDEDTLLTALQEMAQSCRLLSKQLAKQNPNDKKETEFEVSQEWLQSQLSSKVKQADAAVSAALPVAVGKIYQSAKLVAENMAPCSNTAQSSSLSPSLSPSSSAASTTEPNGRSDNAAALYRQKLRPLAFDTVEQWIQPTHYFATNKPTLSIYNNSHLAALKKAKNKTTCVAMDTVKSKAAVLWKELSMYPSALPIEMASAIYVRALEADMEQLRVLIIGPADTPYANGCFFFDVQLHDYPHRPPQVQFLTTRDILNPNSAKVRFNPNLYADGKVCLSLLGTWQGPGWVPGESTLLQVLVSIQSLILGTADPYFNEPGYESEQGRPSGTKSSARYNQRIRQETLRVALLPYWKLYGPASTTKTMPDLTKDADNTNYRTSGDDTLTDESDKKPSPVKRKSPSPSRTMVDADTMQGQATNHAFYSEFETVLRGHFELKKSEIEKQIQEWQEEEEETAKPATRTLPQQYGPHAVTGISQPFVAHATKPPTGVSHQFVAHAKPLKQHIDLSPENGDEYDDYDDLQRALEVSLAELKSSAGVVSTYNGESGDDGDLQKALATSVSSAGASSTYNYESATNSDEDLQKALALSVAAAYSVTTAPKRPPKVLKNGVIDLIDSDSDDHVGVSGLPIRNDRTINVVVSDSNVSSSIDDDEVQVVAMKRNVASLNKDDVEMDRVRNNQGEKGQIVIA